MSLWQGLFWRKHPGLVQSITQVVRKICSHAIWIGCVLAEIRRERDGICVRRLLHKRGHAARMGNHQSQTNVLFRVLKRCLLAACSLFISLAFFQSLRIHLSIPWCLSVCFYHRCHIKYDNSFWQSPIYILEERRDKKATYSQIKHYPDISIKYPLA